MLDRTMTRFPQVKPGDAAFKSEGLRDFFALISFEFIQAMEPLASG